MTKFNSLEAAQQSGATAVFLDSQTCKFWTADNPVTIRAAERLGLVRAGAWLPATLELSEADVGAQSNTVASTAPISGWLITIAVIGSFVCNLIFNWAVSRWRGGTQ